MAITVSIECPACATAFPVDPDKVPLGGARTECTVCETPFRVDPLAWGGEEAEEREPWVTDPGDQEGEAAWEEASQAFEGLTLVEDAAAPPAPSPAHEVAEATERPEGDAVEPAESQWTEEGWEEIEGPDLRLDASPEVEPLIDDADDAGAEESGFPDALIEPADETSFEAPVVEAPFETTSFETTSFEATSFDETVFEEAPSAEQDFEVSSFEEVGHDEEPPVDGVPHTGELVTDQWADLVDAGADGGADVSSDWGSDEGDSWVLETEEDPSSDGGGLEIEVERLHTVEDQVREAKDDPDLTAPAEGVDTNELSEVVEGGFGDFMSGQETILPEGALEGDGPGLDLPDHPVVADFEPAAEDGDGASTFQFGRRDPHDKARRLARVLVSDMITYNPDRHTEARQNGSVRQDFEDEIEKSWAEYVEQVGPELAESTDYWRDALNEVLAGGETLF